VAAAWLACHGTDAARGLRTRRGAAALAALIAVALLVSWSRDLPLLADMVRHGGAAHRFTTLR
jgi:hypothetical protein